MAKHFSHIDNLVNAFRQAGFRTEVDTWQPVWENPKKKPKTVISITVYDHEEPTEFLFNAETGRRI